MFDSKLDRRAFLKVVGVGGASLMLGCYPSQAEATEAGLDALEANAFVTIDPDGMITVTISKSDMGQGVRTSFAMTVAEELDADWSMVRAENAEANPSKYGRQSTGGSSSTRTMFTNLQQAGASARAMLVSAAAAKWNVDADSLRTEMGKVIHEASGRTAGYGELASEASTQPLPTEVQLKPRSEYRIIGNATDRVDNRDVVTGKAIFGQDIQIEGAGYSVVARAPSHGAKLTRFDGTAAMQVPGVTDLVEIPTGVAVIADNTWAAIKGREALKTEWDKGEFVKVHSDTLLAQLKEKFVDHLEMPDGAKVVDAEYEFPYLAHFPMEVPNAVADVKDGTAEIWAPTQSPDGAQGQAARALGMSASDVKVNLTLLGGGFGRKSNNNFVVEAAQISQKAERPIKMIWTREDDIQQGLYRNMTAQTMRGAIADGKAVGWSHVAVKAGRGWGRPNTKFGGADIPYNIPGSGLLKTDIELPITTWFWRSVDHSFINVANEMFIDELAAAAGRDPLDMRMELITSDRLKAVLALAAEKGEWGKQMPNGMGQGIACFVGYGSFAAHVVEVSTVDDAVQVTKVTCAVDPGLAINPSGVVAQMESAVSDGIAASMYAKVTIERGATMQSTPFDYEWARIYDSPQIETHIIEGGGAPGGMGETGYPSVPPAIANAVFAATGKRVRKFPIKLDELV